jgi:CheY-like chemotaxis protein
MNKQQADRLNTPAPMILVVDDEGIVRRYVAQVLTQAGYEVVIAEDGVSAAEKSLAGSPASLLVTDQEMGVGAMTGCELASILMAERPEMGVIVMSGAFVTTFPSRKPPSSSANRSACVGCSVSLKEFSRQNATCPERSQPNVKPVNPKRSSQKSLRVARPRVEISSVFER